MGPLHRLVLCFLFFSAFAFSLQNDAARRDDEATVAAVVRPVPHAVRYSGTIPDAASKTVALSFSLYSERLGGTVLWLETQTVQLDAQGRYSVLLGAATKGGLPLRLFAGGEARWLGVRVAEEGTAEQPRVALVSVPYALTAADAQLLNGRPAADYQLTRAAALASGEAQAPASETSGAVNSTANTVNRVAKFTATDTVGDSLLFDNGTNVGIGTTTPTDKLHVNGAIRFGPGSFTAGVGKFYVDAQHGTLLTATTGTTNDLGIVATSGNLLLTNPTGTNNLVLLSGGGFGVNTSNITEKLTVNGGIQFGPSSFSAGAPTLYKDAAHGSVLTGSQGTQNDLALVSRVGNLLLTNPTATNNLVFFSGGNFGLNTFTPSSLLDVNGQIRTATGIKFGDNTTQTTAATITGVTAGTGLTGGGTSGTVSLSLLTSCAAGQVLQWNGSAWACAAGGGAITAVNTNAGSGLVGGGTTGALNLSLLSSCSSGQVLKWSGTAWTCAADATSGGGGGTTVFDGSSGANTAIVTVNQHGTGISNPDPLTNFPPVAVLGTADSTSAFTVGVAGKSTSPQGIGVIGIVTGAPTGIDENATALLGFATATTGKTRGIETNVASPDGVAAHFKNTNSSGRALQASVGPDAGPDVARLEVSGTGVNNGAGVSILGNLSVSGSITKGSGTFKIDHPLDPEHKYLYHSFVESPDMMNIYNGVITLDAKGEAWVTMPEWFEALNMDFRYQLTAMGRPMPRLFVASEMNGNRFKIGGGKANSKVSWQVTGIRHDAYANAHRVKVEEEKPLAEQGTYLYPDAYQKPVVAKKQ